MTLHIRVERDRIESEKHKSPRYRVRIATSHDGVAVLMSTRNNGSVAAAKSDAEELFGELSWSDVDDLSLRATAEVVIRYD